MLAMKRNLFGNYIVTKYIKYSKIQLIMCKMKQNTEKL